MEGSDPELYLLYWLFRYKNVMPWDVAFRSLGFRELAEAFARLEVSNELP